MAGVGIDGLLVLRFRDLNVEPGETIHQHRRCIASHGMCWWGWWARAHEADPSAVLDELILPRSVALYDTDRGLVFRAQCEAVESSRPPSLSPDAVRTPSYYNNRRLPAWFGFCEIGQADPSWVVGRRCIYMPLQQGDTGWLVETLEDLRQQAATMWILSMSDTGGLE